MNRKDKTLGIRVIISLHVALIFLCPPMAFGQSSPSTKKRPITVTDAISATRLGDDLYSSGGSSVGRVAHFSPDGERFLVVLEKGNLEQNTNDFSVLLYETRDVFRSPKPNVVLRMSSSSSYHDGIRDIRWLDNELFAFLGEKGDGPSQVYTFNVRTHTLKKLTDHPSSITNYDITKDGHKIVFAAEPPVTRTNTDQERREGIVITGQFLEELISNEPLYPDAQLFVQLVGKRSAKIAKEVRVQYTGLISISPNGRYALVAAWVRNVPPEWSAYENRYIQAVVASHLQGQLVPLSSYLVLDTTTGSLVPLFNTPNSRESDPPRLVWAPDGESVSLRTYLPLDVADPIERERRSKHPMAVRVRLQDGTYRVIPEEDLHEAIGAVREEQIAIDVTLDEDMNTPPKIYASDAKSSKRGMLIDLNPQFAELDFGQVESTKWKTTAGNEQTGGLFLPPDYERGKRYPLVIQTHGFNPSRFSMDGLNEWSSAFAARMLTAKGFVVLQTGKVPTSAGTTSEAPAYMAGYEGAIDDLDKRGLIDRERVGISGFSRSVYTVGYTLTHSNYQFGAAVLVDGITGGYFQYLAWGNDTDDVLEDGGAVLNGGRPFGDTLKLWMKDSPGFNLDKVSAPVRVVALGRPSVLVMWEWFCGLWLQNKPVDFIEIPEANHLLKNPWQRRASMQGIVDWFSFWLKDEEDSDPGKKNQYARWRELRKRHSVPR